MIAVALVLAAVSLLACDEPPTATPAPTPTATTVPPTPSPEPTENGHWQHDPCGPAWSTYRGPTYEGFLHWTGDGSHLVFDQADMLVALDIEDGTFSRIADADADFHARTPIEDSGFRFSYGFYADVFPAGSQIVYSSCEFLLDNKTPDRLTEGYELVIVNIDGTDMSRLTRLDRLEHYPVWSPDGKRIAFVGGAFHGTDFYPASPERQDWMKLAILNTEDASVNALLATSRVALYPPAWSPDGQTLAYLVNEGEDSRTYEFGVWTVGLDDGNPVRIGDAVSPPTWSPDGEQLAFVTAGREEVVVYASRPDGTERREVWRGGYWYGLGDHAQALWSPDGSEILVISRQAYLVRADGMEQRVLVPDLLVSDAAWSPDGSWIVLREERGFSIVSRDGTALRRFSEAGRSGGLLPEEPTTTPPAATTEPATDSPTPVQPN